LLNDLMIFYSKQYAVRPKKINPAVVVHPPRKIVSYSAFFRYVGE